MTTGASSRGWRLLGWFWTLVGGTVIGLAATLAILGAPPPEPETPPIQAEAPAAVPAPPALAPPPPTPPTTLPAVPQPPAPEVRDIVIAAADPALLESGPHGPLPRVAADGRTAMRVYARPVELRETRPRVALVVGGIGLNMVLTEQAIARLPPGVTLAINPYAPRPAAIIDRARSRGMEFLMALPLEPAGFPMNDPGPQALLSSLTPAQNEDRLHWVLSRFHGYVGAIGALGAQRGERFAALSAPYLAMQDNLRRRGLLYVEARPGARGPERAWGRAVDLLVDEPGNRADIDASLRQLEGLARARGTAVGLAGEITPVVIERLVGWAESLEARGIVLVPVSSIIRRPEGTP